MKICIVTEDYSPLLWGISEHVHNTGLQLLRMGREVWIITWSTAWTLGVYDTDRPGANVVRQRVVAGLANGCIILLHDGRGSELHADTSQVVDALPGIIDEVRRRGYLFATVGQLIAGEPAR